MAEAKVFYSWQSDLPAKTNCTLIGDALEAAVGKVRDAGTIEVEPVVDRDTEGVPGAPEIAATILRKIEGAAAFVCDVSRINGGERGRPTPNPNVLIELGYAMRALGPDRVVQVLNLAYGKVEELPFDLRQRRTLTYASRPDDESRVDARKALADALARALEAILSTAPVTRDLQAEAYAAIRNQAPDRGIVVRDAVHELVTRVEAAAPQETAGSERDELLMAAIDRTADHSAAYARLCSLAARQRDEASLMALFHGIEGIAQHYDPPHRFAGTWSVLPANYFAFVGREWVLLLVASLLRHGHVNLAGKVLSENLYVDNIRGGSVPYTHLSRHLELLEWRMQRLNLRRLSLLGDLLHARQEERKTSSDFGPQDMADADYLLSLRVATPRPQSGPRLPWFPTVAIHGERTPRFLDEARSVRKATELAGFLGVASVDDLRKRLADCRRLLPAAYPTGWPDDPLEDFDIQRIGSREP